MTFNARLLGLGPLLALALTAGACGPRGDESGSAPADTPVAEVATPSARVALRTPGEQAALAPFGLLRVAPVLEEGVDGPALRALRHGRHMDAEAPDFWLSIGSAALPLASIQASPGRLRIDAAAGAPGIEATTTGRVALYRITAPPGETIVLRLAWQPGGEAETTLLPARGRRDVSGELTTAGGLQLHLALDADRSFTPVPEAGTDTLALHFPPAEAPLVVRLSLSTVDHGAARASLAEPGAAEFDVAARATMAAWDEWLGRLSVSGEEEARARLATDHYRVLARYGDIADGDGRYRGPTGEVRRVPPGSGHIGNLDLSRDIETLIPLLALLAPEKLDDLWDTLLAHEQAAGRFPVATSWGRERSRQEGEDAQVVPALPVLAALAARQPEGVRVDRALPAMIKAGTLGEAGGLPWSEYLRYGYYPADRAGEGGIGKSLRASEAHHAIAAVSAQLGESDVAQAFLVRALFYRQLWDGRAGGFRGRNADRSWAGVPEASVREANLWYPARFDIDGLLELVGGRSVFRERLDAAFSAGDTAPMDPALASLPWLYAFSNAPGRAETAVRARLERPDPSPLPEAAAWRVFATLGLFPVSPSRGDYVLSLPATESARLRLGEAELLLEAPGTGMVLEAAGVDGSRLPGRTVSHRRLAAGGVLLFERREEQGGEG